MISPSNSVEEKL